MIVLDTPLCYIQHYKVHIKYKGSNPGKKYCPSLHLGVVAIEKGASQVSPWIWSANLTKYEYNHLKTSEEGVF